MQHDDGMEYLDTKITPWVPLLDAITKFCKPKDDDAARRIMTARKFGNHWLHQIKTRRRGRVLMVPADEFADRFNGRGPDQE